MLKTHMAACLVATALAAAPAFAQSTTAPSGGTDRPAASAFGLGAPRAPPRCSRAAARPGQEPASRAARRPWPSRYFGSSGSTSGASGSASSATGHSETPMPSPGAASTAAGTGSVVSGTSARARAPRPSASRCRRRGRRQVMSQQQPGQWMASKLIGTTVVGPNNESIGDVNDVLLDRSGQAVGWSSIGVGGFLGIGEKDVAGPFGSTRIHQPRRPRTPRPRGKTGMRQRARPRPERTASFFSFGR